MNLKKYKIRHLSPDERLKIIDRLTAFLNGHEEISFAYVYGSFAEARPFHDIDIGVYIAGIKAEDSTLYALDLAQILSEALRLPVDIRVLNHAPFLFLYHVIRGRLVCEREEEVRASVAYNTVLRYLDIKPLIRRGIKEAFSASC